MHVRLEIDRPDPENREFNHPDPIGWTQAHRAEILRAFYTILLGNPQLDAPRNAEAKTRFKMWWRIVGAAIEHAAGAIGQTVDFKTLFAEQDEEDEDAASLADALETLARHFSTRIFKAHEVARIVNSDNGIPTADSETLRNFLYPGMNERTTFSANSVGKQLKKRSDNPVRSGDGDLTLRWNRDTAQGAKAPLEFHIDGAPEAVAAPDYLVKKGDSGKSKDVTDNQRRKG